MAVQFVLVVPFFTLTVLRYNSAGQLFCVLCNVPVKSAILWDSHVLGKKHKEVNNGVEIMFIFMQVYVYYVYYCAHLHTTVY